MIKKFLIISAMIVVMGGQAFADDDIFANEGVTSFKQDDDAWRRKNDQPVVETTPQEPEILPIIKENLGPVGLKNMEQAEKIFCYNVDKRPSGYEGYTINGLAVTGFCGVIKDEAKDLLLKDMFKTDRNILFNVREDCVISPKILLRFVRGVDTTDVLISSPCYSFTIYYSGAVNIYNAKPMEDYIKSMVTAWEKNKVKFVSPALLDQLLPVGVPQTAEQKELVSTRVKPIRNWDSEKPAEEKQKPKKNGWNNLDMEM